MNNSFAHKPIHGGYVEPDTYDPRPMVMRDGRVIEYPSDKIAAAIGVNDTVKIEIEPHQFVSEQRKAGFNYGTGWGPSQKPPIYFEAVQLSNVLREAAHDATAISWAMEMAIRDVRHAETEKEKRAAVKALSLAVEKVLAHPEVVDLRLLVNKLTDQIDEMAPPAPSGYQPNLGLQYAARPLRGTIAKIRDWLRSFPG